MKPGIRVMLQATAVTLMAASGKKAVSTEGTQVNFSGVQTNGNAGNAAARGSSLWDDEE
jgi:hypothetical protein